MQLATTFYLSSLSLNASSTKNREGNKTGEDRKRRSEAKKLKEVDGEWRVTAATTTTTTDG